MYPLLIDPLIPEIWKLIDFFNIKENSYMISNMGRVYSFLKHGYLSPALSNGYYTQPLQLNDGSRKTFYIHRLVAKAFVYNPNPNYFLEVNHKNLDRSDVFFLNLEWTTKLENIRHELEHSGHGVIQKQATKTWSNGISTYGQNNGMAKYTENQIRVLLSAIENGNSLEEALSLIGLDNNSKNRGYFGQILRGHKWRKVREEYNIQQYPLC